jgi:hypothetical protein
MRDKVHPPVMAAENGSDLGFILFMIIMVGPTSAWRSTPICLGSLTSKGDDAEPSKAWLDSWVGLIEECVDLYPRTDVWGASEVALGV